MPETLSKDAYSKVIVSQNTRDLNDECSTATLSYKEADEGSEATQRDCHNGSMTGDEHNSEADTDSSNSSLRDCLLKFIILLAPELAKCVHQSNSSDITNQIDSAESGAGKCGGSGDNLKNHLLRLAGDSNLKVSNEAVNLENSESEGKIDSECSEEALKACMYRFIELLCPEWSNVVENANADHSAFDGVVKDEIKTSGGNDEGAGTVEAKLSSETQGSNNCEVSIEQRSSGRGVKKHNSTEAVSSGLEAQRDVTGKKEDEGKQTKARKKSVQPCISVDGPHGDSSEFADGFDSICSEDIFGECFLRLVEQSDPDSESFIVQREPPETVLADARSPHKEEENILQHSTEPQSVTASFNSELTGEGKLIERNSLNAQGPVCEDFVKINKSVRDYSTEGSVITVDYSTTDRGEVGQCSDQREISLYDVVADRRLMARTNSPKRFLKSDIHLGLATSKEKDKNGAIQEFDTCTEELPNQNENHATANSINVSSKAYPDDTLTKERRDQNVGGKKVPSSPSKECILEKAEMGVHNLCECVEQSGETSGGTNCAIEEDLPLTEKKDGDESIQEHSPTITKNINPKFICDLKNNALDQTYLNQASAPIKKSNIGAETIGTYSNELKCKKVVESIGEFTAVDMSSEKKGVTIENKAKSEEINVYYTNENGQDDSRDSRISEEVEDGSDVGVFSEETTSNGNVEIEDEDDLDELRRCLLAIADEFYPELADCIRKCLADEDADADPETDRSKMRICLENFAAQFYPKGVLGLVQSSGRVGTCISGVGDVSELAPPAINYIQRLIFEFAQIFHPNLADQLQPYLSSK